MKVRKGFVSNSSTTSFTIFGYCSNEDEDRELFEELENSKLFEENNISCYSGEWETWYLGTEYADMPGDETRNAFEERIKKILKEALGKDIVCGFHQEAFRNG